MAALLPDDIALGGVYHAAAVLAACDRRAAGPTAPARGLCLMDVAYDEGVLSDCP